jgi:hypothetical protein
MAGWVKAWDSALCPEEWAAGPSDHGGRVTGWMQRRMKHLQR